MAHFADKLTTYRQRINHCLALSIEQLDDSYPLLQHSMHYALLQGGKRLRPILTYAVGELLSAEIDDLDIVAQAVEMIHAYSLVHDDLPAMDNDSLRRGQPTVHKQFDEATAILTGDALQSLAFATLAGHSFSSVAQKHQVIMIKLLADKSGALGMCSGQAIDLDSQHTKDTLIKLKRMHQLKTGALFKATILLAVLSAGIKNGPVWDALLRYANNIGLIYQIKDDILDITSNTEVLGKPIGSDIINNKDTYISVLGLTTAEQQLQELVEHSIQLIQALPYSGDFLIDLVKYIAQRDH